MALRLLYFLLFFFNDTATTEIYTLSLHDALPISWNRSCDRRAPSRRRQPHVLVRLSEAVIDQADLDNSMSPRSEEHTSEFQSPDHLVCRLLLEKKKNKQNMTITISSRRTISRDFL